MADLKFLASEWPTISRRLDEALLLTAADRDTWLESLQETESIKLKLRGLLAESTRAETRDFLDAPPSLTLGFFEGSPPVADADAPRAGMLIGPYRLLAELGVGGMGSVWLAERADGGLKREVALKLPRVNWSQGLAERMRRERDILASLDHPNIARIYEAGLDAQGRPYLALEYVEGVPIDVYCMQRALDINERLKLLRQVARAVAHAHARLVVHRDLKPANILVTADGQVRLLDFGIAKLMEGELTQETQLTQVAGRALTLDYASPEQIRGEPIGTASDVYSLGVVAYELLAEAKPYQLKRQSAAALEEAIANVDVRLASVATENAVARKALTGDLDAILNKSLKKNVTERYSTVDAFAQDIERHLAHLPVQAQPDALGYRARKFVRRHTLVIAAATVVSASLIGGLSAALWQRQAARAQAARAEQVKDFVVSVLGDANTDSGANQTTTAADLLKAARQRLAADLTRQPDLAVELMTTVANSMIGQGLYVEAAALIQEAVNIANQKLGPQHELTVRAQALQGAALSRTGRSKEAITLLTSAIDSARRAGDSHTVVAGLGWLTVAQMNDGVAAAACVETARLAVAALSTPARTGDALGARDVSQAHLALANALIYAEQPGAAAAAERALAAGREIYGQADSQSMLIVRTLLARALVMEGQLDAALREADRLIPSAVALLGPQHPAVADVAALVGNTRLDAGNVTGAINAFEQAKAIRDAVTGSEGSYDQGSIRWLLATAHSDARHPEIALPLFDETIRLFSSSLGADHLVTMRARSVRAEQLIEAGKLIDAEAAFEQLSHVPWTGLPRAGHTMRRAALRSAQGRHGEALALAEEAITLMSASTNTLFRAKGLTTLGIVRLDAGQPQAALASLREADAIYARSELGISPRRADLLVALGRTQTQLADLNAAAASLKSAERAWQVFDAKNRHTGLAKLFLADALWAQGDKVAAQGMLNDAEAVLVASAVAADRTLLQSMRQKFATQ